MRGNPQIDGRAGQAWRIAIDDATRAKWPATCDSWLLHAPGAHPLWQFYLVGLISLRDVPGLEPAKKRHPSMTHELHVVALDPDHNQAYDPSDFDTCSSPRWLHPLNLAEQFEIGSDRDAN